MTRRSRFNKLLLVSLLLSTCYSALINVEASSSGDIIWSQTLNLSESIDDRAMKVAIDGSGLYIAGFDAPTDLDIQWRIQKRNLTDGSVLWSQTSNPSSSIDFPNGIAVDGSGVYIVGYGTDLSMHSLWRIEKRSLTDGTLIPSFGTGGIISEDLSVGNDYATSITVDSSGIYIVGYDTLPGDTEWRIEKRSSTTGSIMWAQTSNPSADFDAPTSVAVDSSGLYVVGSDKVLGNSEWRIEKRSLTSGSLVATFGTDGVITENPSSTEDAASKIIAHSSGLYISGYDSSPGTGTQWRIEKRSFTDGSVSWTQLSRGGLFAKAYGLTVDDSGVYIVGDDDAPSNEEWRIEKRSLTSGDLLSTFGTGGVIVNNLSSGDDLAYDITFDSSGIYIVGYDSVPGNKEWRIEKRDPARPANKLAITTNPSTVTAGSWTTVYTVQRQDQYGNTVASGSTTITLTSTSTGGAKRFSETSGGTAVTSITIPDGNSSKNFYYYDEAPGSWTISVSAPDLTSDNKLLTITPLAPLPGGEHIWVQTSNPSSSDSLAFGVAVDDSGIYVVGYDFTPGNEEWRIEKRNLVDGSLLWSQTSNPSTELDVAYAVAVDSSGLYIVGCDHIPGNREWRIEKRNLTDGSLIPTFGTGGVITENPSVESDGAAAAVVDSSGLYIVGGDSIPSNREWRIEKRNLVDGSLLWSQTSNPSTGSDSATAVAVDSSGVYVAGYDSTSGDYEWRIEKRSLTDGSLISTFGVSGIITEDLSSGNDVASSVALDGSGVYLTGWDNIPSNEEWRIEKRNLVDGSLLWSQTNNPTTGTDNANEVAVDSTALYIAGEDNTPGNKQWRIEKRSLTDGSLLWSKTSNPSGDFDSASSVAVDDSGVYIAGYDYIPGNGEWRIEKRDPSRPASKLVIMVHPSSVTAGSWTSKYTVQRRDFYDNPVSAGSNLIYLTSTSSGAEKRFAETPDGAPVTSVTISNGSSTKDFYYYDDAAGSCTIGVTSSDLAGDGKLLTISSPSGCIIVTAAYGSEMNPEVVYMRHVRDGMIGSNEVGRSLVDGWNIFYYSWSPSLAQFISTNPFLKPFLRVLLLPLVGIVYVTGSTYESTQFIDVRFASVVAFIFAAVLSTTVYILTPMFTIHTIHRRQRSARCRIILE